MSKYLGSWTSQKSKEWKTDIWVTLKKTQTEETNAKKKEKQIQDKELAKKKLKTFNYILWQLMTKYFTVKTQL